MGKNSLEFDVIVPAFRAESTLGDCLTAIERAGFGTHEVIVVNDGSPDRTGEIAKEFGARVVNNAQPTRPARARNAGAALAKGDILVFVDSDVVVHPGLRERLEGHFTDPDLAAVIGSYDDTPHAPSVVSRYRNILHHATHQDAAGEIKTFWSGLGAMRRKDFEDAGGFDPFWEDIEDVELGLRVSAEGNRIFLDAGMLGTHLKDWTLTGMFRTDLHGRAVPWTRLLRSGRIPFGTLNTSPANTISAASVAAAVATLAVSAIWPPALFAFILAVVIFVVVNVPLLKRLAGAGGILFALLALPYHAVHYLAGMIGYAKVHLVEVRKP